MREKQLFKMALDEFFNSLEEAFEEGDEEAIRLADDILANEFPWRAWERVIPSSDKLSYYERLKKLLERGCKLPWFLTKESQALVWPGGVETARRLRGFVEHILPMSVWILFTDSIMYRLIEDGNLKEAIEELEELFLREDDIRKTIEIGDLETDDVANILWPSIKKFDEKGMLKDVVERVDLLSDVDLKGAVLSGVCEGLGEEGRGKEALEIASKIEDEDWKEKALYHSALGLVREGNFQKVMEIAQSLRNSIRQLEVLVKTVRAMREKGMEEDARKIGMDVIDALKEIPPRLKEKIEESKEWVRERIFDLTIEWTKVLSLSGFKEEGEQILDDLAEIAEMIKEEEERTRAYRKLSIAFKEVGISDKAAKSFGELINWLTNIKEKRPAFTFRDLASKVLGETIKEEDALQLIKDLRQPTIKEKDALQLLKDLTQPMVKEEDALQLIKDLRQPEEQAYAYLFLSYDKKELLRKALQSARKVKDERGRSRLLAQIAIAYAEKGDFAKAEKVLDEVEDALEKVNAQWEIAEIMRKAGKEKKAKMFYQELLGTIEALPLLEGMDFSLPRPEVLSRLAMIVAKEGRIDRALSIARRIGPSYHQAEAYASIGEAMLEKGDLRGAFEMGEMAWDNLRSINEKVPVTLFEQLIEIMVRAGRVDRALEIAESAKQFAEKEWDNMKSIRVKELVSDTLLEQLIEFMVKSGKVGGAFEIVESEKQWDVLQRYGRLVLKIADILIEMKRLDELKEVVERIGEEDNAVKAGVLVKLSSALRECGSEEEARRLGLEVNKLMQAIKKHPPVFCRELYPLPYRLFLRGGLIITFIHQSDFLEVAVVGEPFSKLLKKGKFEEAFEIAKGVERLDERIRLLIALAKELANAIEKKPWGIFDDAIRDAKSIENDRERDEALFWIIDGLLKVEQIDRAKELVKEIKNEMIRVDTILKIAESLMEKGNKQEAKKCLEEGERMVSEMEDSYQKSLSQKRLASDFLELGELEKAKEIANGIEVNFIKEEAIALVAEALAKEDRVEEALEMAKSIEDNILRARTIAHIGEISINR
jgi:tetratricopeptide (TPR) repeat protein